MQCDLFMLLYILYKFLYLGFTNKNYLFRIIPIVAILFVVIYWIVGLIISNNPIEFGVVEHSCDLT